MQKWIAVLLMAAMLLSTVGCGAAQETGAAEQETSGNVIFTDDCGREVEVPAKVERIVPTGPVAQVVLYTIAPDLFVGLASKWSATAQGIVPEKYLELPYFGQLYNTANLNVEELALADPQLIIDIGKTMSGGGEDMDTLQSQTNIPTVFISASLETMPETYRKLGKLLGREEKAEELAAFCERVYQRTVDIMDRVGENKVNALYVIGEAGSNVLANGSYHSELVDLLTNNIAVVDSPSSKGSGNEVTMEQIALWDPDLILFTSDSIYDTVASMDTWREISAVASGNYLEIPESPFNWMGTPPAVQRYLGMIWLTAQLYPEYCDYDPEAEVKEFYRLFYNCELTQEQFDTLTAKAVLGD